MNFQDLQFRPAPPACSAVPLTANTDPRAFLSVGSDWLSSNWLGDPEHTAHARLGLLAKRLDINTPRSLHHYLRLEESRNNFEIRLNPALEPANIYELGVFLTAAGCGVTKELLRAPGEFISKGARRYSCKLGEIELDLKPSDSSVRLKVSVSDRAEFDAVLATTRLADRALGQAEHFVERVKLVQAGEVDLKLRQGGAIVLGSVSFKGSQAAAAMIAFVVRAFSCVCTKWREIDWNDLDGALARVLGESCELNRGRTSQQIGKSWLGVSIEQNGKGGFEAKLSYRADEITRSNFRWFGSSEIARELASLALVTGVADALAPIKGALLERDIKTRFGTGYAHLTRLFCEIISGAQKSHWGSLRDLSRQFEGALPRVLQRLSNNCHSQSSRLVVELLIGALKAAENPPAVEGQYKSDPTKRAVGCDDVECFFVESISKNQYWTDRDFLYKRIGEQTALCRRPVLVNGVEFPRGTLVKVEREGDKILTVTPARLTAFALPNFEANEVFYHHLQKMTKENSCSVDEGLNLVKAVLGGAALSHA